jgi:hypothetical protein
VSRLDAATRCEFPPDSALLPGVQSVRSVLIVLTFTAAIAAQTPHGPYADKPGWVCYRGETLDQYKRVHCDCKPPCENEGREDVSCQVYCVPHDEQARRCLCHIDESCESHR